jgi:predicted DNA repair protein MutK
MAGSSFFLLLDDIASVLDDVATMSKVAAKKTAGVLGDDLALNAEQVTGVDASRELPVVWAVAKGSALNKVILVPSALGISLFAPWAISPLLMIGGLFLCWEGAEKILHKLLHAKSEDLNHHQQHLKALSGDVAQLEKAKINGAVRTDFILSAEIIVISLGTVSSEPLFKQAMVLVSISVLMTIGVYGLVAGIVKIDDLGLWLKKSTGSLAKIKQNLGQGLLNAAPWLMRFLSVAGTAAMFLVGGGIVIHAVPTLHHMMEGLDTSVAQAAGALAKTGVSFVATGLVGFACGAILLMATETFKRVRRRSSKA